MDECMHNKMGRKLNEDVGGIFLGFLKIYWRLCKRILSVGEYKMLNKSHVNYNNKGIQDVLWCLGHWSCWHKCNICCRQLWSGSRLVCGISFLLSPFCVLTLHSSTQFEALIDCVSNSPTKWVWTHKGTAYFSHLCCDKSLGHLIGLFPVMGDHCIVYSKSHYNFCWGFQLI